MLACTEPRVTEISTRRARRPTPALCLCDPLATLRGSRPGAGAAMVCAPPAASEALALTRMSRPCFCPAWLSPKLSKPGALLTVACTFCGRATMSGLSGRLLQLTQTSPLLVLAYPLIDVAFEPGLFGCHLKPHDAPARTAPKRSCSLGCENGNFGAVSGQIEVKPTKAALLQSWARDMTLRNGLSPRRRAVLCSLPARLQKLRVRRPPFHLPLLSPCDGAVEGEGDRRRQVPVAAFILKNEARSRVGAQQLTRHLWLGEFVEELAGAVQRNNVVDVQPFESGDGLADIIL